MLEKSRNRLLKKESRSLSELPNDKSFLYKILFRGIHFDRIRKKKIILGEIADEEYFLKNRPVSLVGAEETIRLEVRR